MKNKSELVADYVVGECEICSDPTNRICHPYCSPECYETAVFVDADSRRYAQEQVGVPNKGLRERFFRHVMARGWAEARRRHRAMVRCGIRVGVLKSIGDQRYS